MPTTKQRIAVTIDDDMKEALRLIAKRDKIPAASAASTLLRMALEIDEDAVLGMVMDERDTPDATYLSHEEAWKRIRHNQKKYQKKRKNHA